MKVEQSRQSSPWTVVTLTAAILLFLNFLAFGVLSIVGMGLLLDPVAAIVTAVLILLGMGAVLLVRHRDVPKRWLRTLIAAIVCNFLIIVLYCGAAVLLLTYLNTATS